MKTKDIHIGSVIKQKFEESSLTIVQFAQLIYCDRTTVYDLFKRKSIDVDRLLVISEALCFNFLWEIYLKNNPIMAYSTADSFNIEVSKEDTEKMKTSEHVNICLKIIE